MVSIDELYQGYKAASSGSFRTGQVQAGLNPYKIQLSQVRGTGLSDIELRRMAARAVLKRYYLTKAGKDAPANYNTMSLADLKSWIASQ